MKAFYSIFLLILFCLNLNAQIENGETDEKVIKKKLVKYLNEPSNLGQDFWLSVPPPLTQESVGYENFTRFFIVASGDANVKLQQPSGVFMSMFVPAGDVRSFDLKPGECQPFMYNYGGTNIPPPAQVYEGKGINITSDQPIVVYVVVRYRWTSDGYLALPTQGLGTKYISSVYDSRPIGTGSLPNMHTIVACYDRTKIKFTLGGGVNQPTVQILGGKELKTGDSHEWTINKGDVIVLSNVGPAETLSGSLIEGNKPFSNISGQFCTDITVFDRACDYTVEMDIPIHAWGKIYPITWIRNRRNSSYLRVFAKEPGTTVWRDGQEIFYFTQGVEQVGGTQNNAWIEQRIWPTGFDPNVAMYTSDKPIYVCLYNPSQSDDNVSNDPFSMIMTPIEQYQNEIVFSTPAAPGGLNFTSNWMNIVIETDENGLVPEDLQYGLIEPGGEVDWQNVRTIFGGTLDKFYVIGSGGDADALQGSKYVGKQIGEKSILLPADGAYAIRSSKLFTCYSYGYDNYDSYGYPTSTALRVISEDTVAPLISWEMDCIGNIEGTTTDLPEDDAIRVGLSIPNLIWEEVVNYIEFEYDNNNFVPGTETTAWSLKVDDPTKYAKAIVVFFDRSGNVSRDTIEYYPELIDLREVAADDDNGNLYDHNHGVLGLGETKLMRYEIENLSDSRTFSLNEVKLRFNDQNFTIEPLGWNLTDPFAPNEIREFTVSFITNEEGRFLDSIGLSTECTDKFYSRIQAETGIPGITVDDYNFPVQTLIPGGNPPVQSVDLRISNICEGVNGTQPLVITGFTEPTNPDFTHNLASLTFPLVIDPNEQVSFRVTFQPTAVGVFSDEIVFITEKGELGCDPVCKITSKVIEAGLVAQDHNWGKVRIDYPKQANTYAPNGSELITAYNTSSGDDGAALTIDRIIFQEGSENEVANPLNAFSFENNFNSMLPTNPNNYFVNVQIPKESNNTQRQVYFRPQTVGKYEIEYYFENSTENSGEETTYLISGHGIVPNMILYHVDGTGTREFSSVDFGEITAGIPTEAVTKEFTIKNEPLDSDNGDVLTISDINWGPNISTDPANPGNRPFVVDEVALLSNFGTAGNYPIVIGINQEINFDVIYYSDVVGNFTEVIRIESNQNDADESGVTGEYNNEITVTGSAIRPSITRNAIDLYSCISNELIVDENYPGFDDAFYYENDGTKDVTINSVNIQPKDGNNAGINITIDGAILRKGDGSGDVNLANISNVSLSPNDRLIVLLTYLPTANFSAAPKTMVMNVNTDIQNPSDQPQPIEFDCTSDNFVKSSSSIVYKADGSILNTPGENINYNVENHRNLDFTVSLDNNPDITDAALTTLDVVVEYRKSYLTYDMSESVELLGNYSTGYDIVGLSTNYRFEPNSDNAGKFDIIEEISFKIVAQAGNIINAGGELFVVHFNTGLPNIPAEGYTDGLTDISLNQMYVEGRDEGSTKTFIRTQLFDPSGNGCASITPPNQIDIDLDPVCGMALRPLSTSNFDNQAGLVSPNPVSNAGASIDFSIAFDSETVVRIIDTKGDVVAVLNNSSLKAGEYSLQIPVDKLSNGTYIYEIKSFGLNVSDKFVVQK